MCNAGGTQVKIISVEVGHGPRGEIIVNREIGVKLHHAIAVGLATGWEIIVARAGDFGGLKENVAGFIGGKTGAGLPDGSQSPVGRRVEDREWGRNLGTPHRSACVVGKDPAAVLVVAAVRAEADVKHTVEQQEAGAVFLVQAVEDGDVSLFAGRLDVFDLDGTARLLIAARDVEGVDVVTDGAVQQQFLPPNTWYWW